MSALPPAMEGTIMRTGFVGYVSAAQADVPTIAPAIAMQITAIRFMVTVRPHPPRGLALTARLAPSGRDLGSKGLGPGKFLVSQDGVGERVARALWNPKISVAQRPQDGDDRSDA